MRPLAGSALAAIALALAVAGCGGDGGSSPADAKRSQAQARATVCAASADIDRQVTVLRALTPELQSVPQVKAVIAAITADLARIRAARPGLAPETAARAAEAERRVPPLAQAVTRATLSGGLAGDVRGALEPAVDGLARGARSVLRPLGC